MDELTDRQIKVLTKADIYRETGGEEAQKQMNRPARGPSGAGGMPSTSRF